MRLLFRADASQKVGMGHFKRVCELARGVDAELLLGTDEPSLISEAQKCFKKIHLVKEPEEASIPEGPFDFCVWDVSHSLNFARPERVASLLRSYRKKMPLAIIDGLGGDSLQSRLQLDCDVLITPYFGSKPVAGTFLHLSGPEYFVLPEHFQGQGHVPRPKASKVLITMGGADPTDMTSRILGFLLLYPEDLEIRVIIGPLFSAELEKNLYAMGQKNVTFVKSPSDMKREYIESDVVISASGLAKYELATLGVPMMLVSRDATMDEANSAFVHGAGCINLGVCENIEVTGIHHEMHQLIGSYDLRFSMSQRLKRLIDGQGKKRILECLARK